MGETEKGPVTELGRDDAGVDEDTICWERRGWADIGSNELDSADEGVATLEA